MRPSMISTQRAPVLQTYHELLRAIGFAFKGDQAALTQARVAARQSFRKPHEEKQTLPQRIEHAQSVVKILYENVVQGSKAAADQDKPYKLNIHERIERGDNSTIKKLGGTGKSFKSMKS